MGSGRSNSSFQSQAGGGAPGGGSPNMGSSIDSLARSLPAALAQADQGGGFGSLAGFGRRGVGGTNMMGAPGHLAGTGSWQNTAQAAGPENRPGWMNQPLRNENSKPLGFFGPITTSGAGQLNDHPENRMARNPRPAWMQGRQFTGTKPGFVPDARQAPGEVAPRPSFDG